MMRGSRVELTVLNNGEVAFNEAQQIGLVWLKVLNVSQRNWPGKDGSEGLDARELPATKNVANNALLGAHPWKFIDEVSRDDMATVGDRWSVVVFEVAADLRNCGSTSAAIRGIRGEAV